MTASRATIEYVPRRMAANLPSRATAGRPHDRPRPAMLERVRAIPPGLVATYCDLDPAAPRFAGTVLSACGPAVPWHRVVRADGSLTQGERQAALLDAEGVPLIGRPRRVDVRLARWWRDVDPA